jgi:hypothetical protein
MQPHRSSKRCSKAEEANTPKKKDDEKKTTGMNPG